MQMDLSLESTAGAITSMLGLTTESASPILFIKDRSKLLVCVLGQKMTHGANMFIYPSVLSKDIVDTILPPSRLPALEPQFSEVNLRRKLIGKIFYKCVDTHN